MCPRVRLRNHKLPLFAVPSVCEEPSWVNVCAWNYCTVLQKCCNAPDEDESFCLGVKIWNSLPSVHIKQPVNLFEQKA